MPGSSASVERRFATAAFWSLVGGALSRAGSLVAAILVARILEPAKYGQLSMITSTCLLVSSFAGLGLGLAVTKHVAQFRKRDPGRARSVIRVAYAGTLVAAGMSGAILLVGAPWVSREVLSSPELESSVRWMAVWMPLAAMSMTQAGVFTGLEAFRALAVWSGARGLVGAILFVGGAVAYGVPGSLAGLTLAELGGVVTGFFGVRRECVRQGLTEIGGWRSEASAQLRFGLTSILGSAATVPALWLPRLWLARSGGGYAELGVFDAASKWSLAVALLPAFIGQAQLPALTHLLDSGDLGGYRRLKRITLAIVVATSVLPALALAVGAGPLLALSGSGYRQGTVVLVALAASILPMSLNLAFGQFVLSRGLVRVRLVGDWTLAVTMILSSLALIPRLGALGLALAQGVSYTAACAVVGLAEDRQSR